MPFCIIAPPLGAGALEARPPINVNGQVYSYAYGIPVDLPDEAVEAAKAAGFTLTFLGTTAEETDPVSPTSDLAGDGDAAADAPQPGGEDAGGSDTDHAEAPGFDPEAIITGTVAEVTERLANLTREQLEAVAAAETDREAPRKGVNTAIDHALQAFTGA